MSANSLGENFRIVTFGESHGPAVGVVLDGVRPGLPLSVDEVQTELDRRRPGTSSVTSPRREADRVEILSGVFEGHTTGAPILLLVRNENQRSQDYDALKDLFRPGHADYTWWKKFGIRDWRGGGRTSGRETIARVAAGAVARKLLAEAGVRILAHVVQVGSVKASRFEEAAIAANPVRAADPEAARVMQAAIEAARDAGDSLGGVVEIRVTGVPAGWGDPVFCKLDALLGAGLLSIGAVKGVEFGDGFALAGMQGSQSNDGMRPEGFTSNHMGGILGGISSGEPILIRMAVKPTSSIAKAQETVNTANEAATISTHGRHDPCICPRIVPVAEAMVAIVLADAFLRQEALRSRPSTAQQATAALAFVEAELAALLRRHAEIEKSLPPEQRSEVLRAVRAQRPALASQEGAEASFVAHVLSQIDRDTKGGAL